MDFRSGRQQIPAITSSPSVAQGVLDDGAIKRSHEMRNRSSFRWLGTLGVLLAVSPGLAGCYAYTTRNSEIVAPGGSGDFGEIKLTRKAKPTTRDLVQKKLGFLDTGFSSPTFFWGRWVRGKELNFVAIGAPGAGGGSIGASRNAGTVVENLLIEFDSGGQATQWKVVDDDDLLKTMVPILRRNRPSGGQMPPVPWGCPFFQWDQVTRVKSDPPPKRLRVQHHELINLQFFTASDKREPWCAVDVSAETSLRIVNHLISIDRDFVLK